MHDKLTTRADELIAANDEWLTASKTLFDPLNWTDTDAIECRRKAFSELSLYTYVADHYSPESLEELSAFVRERTTDPAYVNLLRRDPTQLLRYAPALTSVHRITGGDETLREAVTEAVRHPTILGTEWAENRQLDVSRLAALVDSEPPFDPEMALNRSAVADEATLVTGAEKDAYAFTHVVLFCTDFATEQVPLGDLSEYELQTTIDGYICRFLAEGHTDLVAELAMCGVITGSVTPAVLDWATEWLYEETLAVGHTPGPKSTVAIPTLSGATPDDTDPEEIEPEEMDLPGEWVEDYHTSLVTGMLGRVLSHRHDRVPELETTIDDEALLTLGAAMDAFSDYRLQEGADKLVQLGGDELPTALEPVVRRIEVFLRDQRREDGTFGYWTDERRQFTIAGHGTDEFEAGPLSRTTAACEEAVNVIESITERHHR
ncbi:MAG: hypothetical protein J07HB67_02637 [halophilic archaeon J07HB67]|jgi:hypothetical protein|nr:MAG: hypothetical protein J07HB67_02637 [halophilic archaeon J07HB67]